MRFLSSIFKVLQPRDKKYSWRMKRVKFETRGIGNFASIIVRDHWLYRCVKNRIISRSRRRPLVLAITTPSYRPWSKANSTIRTAIKSYLTVFRLHRTLAFNSCTIANEITAWRYVGNVDCLTSLSIDRPTDQNLSDDRNLIERKQRLSGNVRTCWQTTISVDALLNGNIMLRMQCYRDETTNEINWTTGAWRGAMSRQVATTVRIFIMDIVFCAISFAAKPI